MNMFQKTNHFPGCWHLGRKDLLWMKISKYRRLFKKDFDFVPKTYLLKNEWDLFNSKL